MSYTSEQLLTNRSEYLEMPLFDLTERLFAELKLEIGRAHV